MSIRTGTTRKIHFTSKGGSYTAIWMGSKGDLYQEYRLGDNGNVTYYPPIDAQDPITMSLTVVSSRSNGAVTPQRIVYYANGVELSFDTSGKCTTTGLAGVFRLAADNNLMIIGNLGDVVLGNYLLQARIFMSAAAGSDSFVVNAPVTLPPYSDGTNARVSICSPDNKNFTITEKGGTCRLKALTFQGGEEQTSGLSYEWYKFVGGEFASMSVTSQELTVQESDVDSNALFKVIVKKNGVELGFDIQSVMDASDPYDIIVDSFFNDGLGGSDVATNDLTLNDEMSPKAYLKFVPRLVKRGDTSGTAVTGNLTWTYSVIAGNGARMFGQGPSAASYYNLTVENLLSYADAIGDYELYIDCELS